MEKDNILGNPVFESYWLAHANADTVLGWLKERKPRGRLTGGQISEELETLLIERHEPLIDLGLALYARLTSVTALRLFRNGDATIKKALLAGPSVSSYLSLPTENWIEHEESGVLKELLQSFDENLELLGFLLSNETIPDFLLTCLFGRARAFSVLTDEQWFEAIERTISNPRLCPSSHIEKTLFAPLSLLEHPCTAAWGLFETLPVNYNSASLLARLGETLAPHGYFSISNSPSDMDVRETIKRWEVEGDDGFGVFRKCRAALGKLLKDEELKDNDDIALRQAYYGGAWYDRKPEEVREAFERDKDKFLEVAVENSTFYGNRSVRDELARCCHDYEFKDEYHDANSRPKSHLGYFNAQSNRLKQQHPEWFPDFDGEIPFEEIGDLSLRAEERLVFLGKQIKAISRELVGTKSEDDDSSWYDDDKASLIDNIKATLDQSNQLVLSKLGSVTGWAVFVGIVFAIILIAILRKL